MSLLNTDILLEVTGVVAVLFIYVTIYKRNLPFLWPRAVRDAFKTLKGIEEEIRQGRPEAVNGSEWINHLILVTREEIYEKHKELARKKGEGVTLREIVLTIIKKRAKYCLEYYDESDEELMQVLNKRTLSVRDLHYQHFSTYKYIFIFAYSNLELLNRFKNHLG